MTRASITITIHASADAVWRLVSSFGAADRYLDGIVDCTVVGDGIGAQRMLTSIDGSTIVERLVTVDESAQVLSYTLLTDTPFCDCLTTMSVRSLGPDRAELAWWAFFQPVGLPDSEALALLEGALMANSLALKQFMETSRPLSE